MVHPKAATMARKSVVTPCQAMSESGIEDVHTDPQHALVDVVMWTYPINAKNEQWHSE